MLLHAKFRPNFVSVTAPLQLQLNQHASDNIIDDTWRKTQAYTNNGNNKHTCATRNSLEFFTHSHTLTASLSSSSPSVFLSNPITRHAHHFDFRRVTSIAHRLIPASHLSFIVRRCLILSSLSVKTLLRN